MSQQRFFFMLFLVFGVSYAQTLLAANDVDLEIRSKVLQGQEKPRLLIKIHRDVNVLKLEIESPKDKVHKTWRGLKKGKTLEVELDASIGQSNYVGRLKVSFSDGGTGEMPLAFGVEVVAPLKIVVPYARMDVQQGKVELTLSEAAGRCQYDVTFDGAPQISGQERFVGEPAGTWLAVHFKKPKADAVVLKIRLVCYDRHGFYSGIDLFPWQLDIPHQDVVFASGRADIEETEKPKLESALADVGTAVRRYGAIIPIKLYISGHTDTVGTPAMNKALSLRRAKAIAAYFRAHGFKLDVLYTGFGETHLAVGTADEVDEVRNRRALYTISVKEPLQATWLKL